ncbi:2-C-methyl-D-erythritol 4-phosphate cytidylyltransferase [candidate division WOR-3 bacterium]|nr:2-C-methyl-D-erythritol 4-phosphate cytidylyltransferase [candidate division WOR-3 bacterium]
MANNQPNWGIIVAAGQGKRFGGLKQFALIKNKPLIFYSIRPFELCSSVSGYVVVTNESKLGMVKTLLQRYRFKKLLGVVAGGKERMDSVEHGLLNLPEKGYVAIHDGARPLLKSEMLIQGFQTCRRYPAVAFGVPINDTIKKVNPSNQIIQTIDRSGLVAIQTPQFFRLDIIRRAYANARAKNLTATDDCALVEHLNIAPRLLPGSPLNIKVTTKEDLFLCQALL